MLEKLFDLKATYEALAAAQGPDAATQRAALGERLIAAFPDLCRELVHAIEENGRLLGLVEQSPDSPAHTTSPLVFEGFVSRQEGDAYHLQSESPKLL
ncbi:hypothetical protein QF001_004425 [Paraburkholderia youngii]|uniref:Uncharacterized protein n=1 Tax=Paraburkholderia youngii TaxID=2782701 RepID=A0A7Y6JW23_9BURK|nr:hypothetical protein [Paraburkholderia youngii]NUX99769.1 hypothetical protein [Paraburkholderia youngii]